MQKYARNLILERSKAKIELTEVARVPLKSNELIYIRYFQPDSTLAYSKDVRHRTSLYFTAAKLEIALYQKLMRQS